MKDSGIKNIFFKNVQNVRDTEKKRLAARARKCQLKIGWPALSCILYYTGKELSKFESLTANQWRI